MHNFKELKVWQKSINLASEIYEILSEFTSEE
ncbi:MAG: four helix bundle protein [Bacteroidetes bacterium]|nr:four helix bundle protein [Bacteroidota bacterium]